MISISEALRLSGVYKLFSESDFIDLAKGNPDLDTSLAMAIKKSNFDFTDLLILQRLFMGNNQTEIANMLGVSKMAISKRVAKIQKKLEPHVKKFLRKGPKKSRSAPALDIDDTPEFGRPGDDTPPSHDYFRDIDKKRKEKIAKMKARRGRR